MKTATLTAKVNRWLHEHLAMKTPAKLLGGLALGALVMAATALPLGTTYADEPARPLSSERIQCYPEDDGLRGCYGFADVLDPALATDATISGVRFEEWPEAGFDSYTYHRFMSEQGKVGKVLSGAVASPSSIDLNEVWTEIEDTPVYHLMKQLKAGSRSRAVDYSLVDWEEMSVDLAERQAFSPSSIDLNEVWPEIDSSTPIHHLLKQLKAASPRVTKRTECYPELQIC